MGEAFMLSARRAAARTLIGLSLSHALAPGAAAQSAPQALPPAVLTIDAAVREAVDHNLTLVAERYSVDVVRARLLTARLRPNPVFTYDAMIPDGVIYDNNVNPFEHVFRVDVVLERGGKRDRRIEVAEDAKSVADLQLLNTIRTIVLDVQGAFVDAVLAKQNLALARQSLDAFDSLVQVNTERVRAGDLAQVELSRSRLAALQFRNDVRLQASKLNVSLGRLKTLIGRTTDASLDVTGDQRRDADAVSLAAVRERARALRPDLQALRRDQARSAAELRLQIAEGKVDYTVSGELHRQRAPHDVLGNQYGLYVSAPIPIFNRNQGEIERARQEERQAAAKIAALEADVDNEVRSAYEAYDAARDIVATIETQMLAQATEVRATTEYSYRRGEASFIEFLDAARAFNDTMQSYNGARADFARSLYALDAISGAAAPSTVTP
jgi:outer membrane protein, heavy metal efflux system